MNEKQPSPIFFITAATLTILGSFAQLFKLVYAPYLFSLGVALLIFLHGMEVFDKTKTDKRQQRLARIGLLTSLMLGIGAYFMFVGSNSWVVMVLIYALSTFFQSFRGNSKY